MRLAGCDLRVTICGLRFTGCDFRVATRGLRFARSVAICGPHMRIATAYASPNIAFANGNRICESQPRSAYANRNGICESQPHLQVPTAFAFRDRQNCKSQPANPIATRKSQPATRMPNPKPQSATHKLHLTPQIASRKITYRETMLCSKHTNHVVN